MGAHMAENQWGVIENQPKVERMAIPLRASSLELPSVQTARDRLDQLLRYHRRQLDERGNPSRQMALLRPEVPKPYHVAP